MRKKGHWFCDACDDIVFMSYEKTEQTNVPCPACGHLACNLIPEKINRQTIGNQWFDKMRDPVNHPELFNQQKKP
jgi:hypothetical protein